MTDKYPDIVVMVKEYCEDMSSRATPSHTKSKSKVTSFIIDSEIVAWDVKNDTTKSFQELSNRPRKDVKLHQVNILVCLFVFDLMHLNGEVRYSILQLLITFQASPQ